MNETVFFTLLGVAILALIWFGAKAHTQSVAYHNAIISEYRIIKVRFANVKSLGEFEVLQSQVEGWLARLNHPRYSKMAVFISHLALRKRSEFSNSN